LLGFIVSHRGIEANPEKIEAIMRMEAPRSQKKVQRLTGCMAALSRFISRLGEKGLPFYKLLKKVDKFQWTSVTPRNPNYMFIFFLKKSKVSHNEELYFRRYPL
jgi:hypothetical protein